LEFSLLHDFNEGLRSGSLLAGSNEYIIRDWPGEPHKKNKPLFVSVAIVRI